LAKMDENQFVIHKQQVEMNDFLEKVRQKILPAFQEAKINLHINCAHQIFVSIDAERFRQVIINLLDNALKYSPTNTTVTIEVRQDKSLTTISVSDEGEGIPEKDLHYIWDRLYRVEKSRSRATGGSGIGLAIVKKIVESHGGEISVTSIVNNGTTFTIQLKDGGEIEKVITSR